MRDVGERARMHQAGLPFERLDQVRLDRLLQQHGHRAGGAEVLGGDRLAAVVGARHGDRAEALAQVVQVARHGEDRHHLGGGRDVEARLARVAVRAAALPERDAPQGAVVHVEGALPVHSERVDRVRVAVEDGGVEERRQQVVGRPDRVDVAREVEVQVLHRDDLREPAAGRAALDAEHRAERWLAQAEQRVLADLPEALRERHGGGGLALPRLGRRNAGHAHELAVGRVAQAVEHPERHLRLVAPVGLELVGLQPGALGDRVDRLKLRLLRDLETALHRHLSSHQ